MLPSCTNTFDNKLNAHARSLSLSLAGAEGTLRIPDHLRYIGPEKSDLLQHPSGVKANLLQLACSLLASEYNKKLFFAARDLLHAMSSLRPMLQAGSGAVVSCADLSVLAQVISAGSEAPGVVRHSFVPLSATEHWQMGRDWAGLKWPGVWPNLIDVYSNALQSAIDPKSSYNGAEIALKCEAKCEGMRHGGRICCQYSRLQHMLGWVLWDYCLHSPLNSNALQSAISKKSMINKTRDRLALMSLVCADNTFLSYDSSDRSIEYKLVVSMLNVDTRVIVWYDAKRLPLRQTAKLVRVELKDSVLRLHMERQVKDSMQKVMLVLMQAKDEDATNTKLQHNGETALFPLLPGLGSWDSYLEERVPSLEDFAQGFNLWLTSRPANLGPWQVTLQETHLNFVNALTAFLCDAPLMDCSSAEQILVDLAHKLLQYGSLEALNACLDRSGGLGRIKKTLDELPYDNLSQMSLIQRACSMAQNTQPPNTLFCKFLDKKASYYSKERRTGFGSLTALHVACATGQLAAVKLLLNAKCLPIDQQDGRGRTSLYVTLASRVGPWQHIANLLIDCGAKVHVKTDDGSSPIELALMFHGDWYSASKV